MKTLHKLNGGAVYVPEKPRELAELILPEARAICVRRERAWRERARVDQWNPAELAMTLSSENHNPGPEKQAKLMARRAFARFNAKRRKIRKAIDSLPRSVNRDELDGLEARLAEMQLTTVITDAGELVMFCIGLPADFSRADAQAEIDKHQTEEVAA
ncbi:MAG: hypothetical protein CMO68_06060 [Verrucomicrobiales bacterium]|nr:hypothetical protein [Verrucomicrobiales bacterium]